MQIEWKILVDLINAIAWPVVVLFTLYLFRRPLVELVAQIARRARKVSVYNVSVDLATLPELSASWSVGSADVRQLTSSQIFDSASQTLFQELLKPGKADYAVVDLGTGREWLTSRLYIFSLILGAVAGLRAFVFLESAAGIRRRFLGIATPASIQRGLTAHYPWLEEAYLRAAAAPYLNHPPEMAKVSKFSNQPSLFTGAEQWRVTNFVQTFIQIIQRSTDPAPDEEDSYLELGVQPQIWERARWIDGERLERDLAGCLEFAWVKDSPDKARSDVAQGIVVRSGPFVALVDDDRRFIGLVDRYAFLDRTCKERGTVKTNSPE